MIRSDSISRKQASFEARRLLEANPLYIDTETTGLGMNAEVIEIGIIDDAENTLFLSRVKPRRKIDPAAGLIHGIRDEDLLDAPTWETVWPQAEAILGDHRVGAYNAEFDIKMINQSNQLSMLPKRLSRYSFFDIMELYARFYGQRDPNRRGYRFQSLEAAGRQCGIALPNAHNAVADCRLTRALLHYMAGVP